MSKRHASLLIAYVLIGFVLPGCISSAVSHPGPLLTASLFFGIIGATAVIGCTDNGFYILPFTHYQRARNRIYGLHMKERELNRDARECEAYAYRYMERGDVYQAEILRVQSDHNKRQAEMLAEDQRRIYREIDDHEAQKLLEGK